MALISCPECSGSCSDAAKACPHCGFPIQAETEAKEEFLSTMKRLAFSVAGLRDGGCERSQMDAALRSFEAGTQKEIATLVIDFIFNNPDLDQNKCVLQVPKIIGEAFFDDDDDDDDVDDDIFATAMQLVDSTVEARDSGVARSELIEIQSTLRGGGLHKLAEGIVNLVYDNPAWNKTMCRRIIGGATRAGLAEAGNEDDFL